MSPISSPKKSNSRAPKVLLSLFLCALAFFFFVMLKRSVYRSESQLLEAASERIALKISTPLQEMLEVGNNFCKLLLTDSGRTYAALKPLAEESLSRLPYIDSITIAPGAIIRYFFPEDRASASIGHDLLENPERMNTLVNAVRKRKAALQGPDISAEGKTLAFLRIPVFEGEELWGFVSIAFDTDKVLGNLDLPSEFPGLSIALVSSRMDGGEKLVFWGEVRALSGYSAVVEIESEDFPWIVYVASSYPYRRVVAWGAGLLILVLVSCGLFILEEFSEKESKSHGRPKEASMDIKPFVPGSESAQKLSMGVSTKAENEPAHLIEEPARVLLEEKPNCISVLIVDDSEVNRDLLLRMLTLKGYEARAVSSAEAALESLRVKSFDIMLIDCVMPEMDGYALAQKIRAEDISQQKGLQSALPRPVLIAMSPRHDQEEAEKCAKAGFDSLLVKPFTMTALDQQIRLIFDDKRIG